MEAQREEFAVADVLEFDGGFGIAYHRAVHAGGGAGGRGDALSLCVCVCVCIGILNVKNACETSIWNWAAAKIV